MTRRPGDPATRRPGDPATRRPGDHAGERANLAAAVALCGRSDRQLNTEERSQFGVWIIHSAETLKHLDDGGKEVIDRVTS